MDFYKDIQSVLVSIGKAHLIVIGILIFSFIIEHTTQFRLFFKDFVRPKSQKQAEIANDRNIGTYFLIMVGKIIYDMFTRNMVINFYTIVFSFLIIYLLTKFFYRIHKKYQAVDPEKADDDFS